MLGRQYDFLKTAASYVQQNCRHPDMCAPSTIAQTWILYSGRQPKKTSDVKKTSEHLIQTTLSLPQALITGVDTWLPTCHSMLDVHQSTAQTSKLH